MERGRASALRGVPRVSLPQVAGFKQPQRQLKYGLKPWMLIVGAIIVAVAAFAITRAFIR